MDKPELKTVSHDLGVDTEAAYIIPLSDLHIGSPGFDDKKFLGYRQWILDRPNAYCVINGDVLEMATKNSIGNTYEALRPKQQKEMALKYLGPLAEQGKILAWIDGNHEHRTSKDTDEYIGEYLTQMLGIPSVYSPDGVLVFINVGYSRRHNKDSRITYTLFMLHGWTGSRRVGGKANNLEDMSKSVMADCYIASHTHQKVTFSRRIVVPEARAKSIRYKKQVFVSAGSFLEWEGYAVRKGYNPVTLGSPRLRLDGTRHDLHVSV